MNLENKTYEELAAELITLDFRGRQVKLAALNELLKREAEKAYEKGYSDGTYYTSFNYNT